MKKTALPWLIAVPGRKKLYILALIVVQALHGASGVLYALLLRGVVDAAAGQDAPGFWRYLVLIILLAAVQLGLRAVIRWLTELSKSTFENIFKGRLNDTLLRKDYLQVSAIHSGEWLNRLTNDTVVVANAYVEILPGLAGMVVKLISALIMIIALEPRFAAIFIPIGLLLVLFSWLFRKKLKRLHKNVQEADGRLRVFLQERISSMLMIRSFSAEAQTGQEAAEKMQEHKAARMRKNHFSNLCNVGFGAAMSGMYLLGVGWCGYGILTGTISFGTLTAITQLITQIQTPFANITGYLPRYYAMLASAERLMEAEAFAEELEEAKTAEEAERFYENELQGIGLKDASFAYYPVSDGIVTVDTTAFGNAGRSNKAMSGNVGTSEKIVSGNAGTSEKTVSGRSGSIDKSNMPAALEHLTLEIRKGEYAAFTGQSGCGKSTALKLIMCVYGLDSGERYYIGADGQSLPLTSAWRRLFAYVPQDNQLMNGTIREVVSFAAPDDAYDEDRLQRALTIACASDFVDELENGADTLLGERGTGLSEGQMQRIAIARAIFSGSPILLLDESTSALDGETEQRLLQNLRSMTDRTVIIVTHRPAALTICDSVMEFTEQGALRKKFTESGAQRLRAAESEAQRMKDTASEAQRMKDTASEAQRMKETANEVQQHDA